MMVSPAAAVQTGNICSGIHGSVSAWCPVSTQGSIMGPSELSLQSQHRIMDSLFAIQLWQTRNPVKLNLFSSFDFSAAGKVLSSSLLISSGTATHSSEFIFPRVQQKMLLGLVVS